MMQQRREQRSVLAKAGPAAAQTPLPLRPDLQAANRSSLLLACRPQLRVEVPTFSTAPPPAAGTTSSTSVQLVPELNPETIRRVKAAARSRLGDAVLRRYEQLQRPAAESGFEHPTAGFAGPLELALMQQRLADGAAVQVAARDSLITGSYVKPKWYDGKKWHPPTDCPPEGYEGPYALPVVDIAYGGSKPGDPPAPGRCPAKYPFTDATLTELRDKCQHVAFVELDAQMAFKQAVAFYATGDVRHAQTAQRILDEWAKVNTTWGRLGENGPLEAAWGGAAMCRAMELLRHSGWQGFDNAVYERFVGWFKGKLLPQMDHFIDVATAKDIERGRINVYNNWASSIADAYMSYGLLTDDRGGYVTKATDLYKATVANYLKWGGGRCSETMRDVFHSLFGLGGLIQVAEAAFLALDEDLYAESGHALAAAMELHARLNNAGADASKLPPGYKFVQSMPKPPPGASKWTFELERQLYTATDSSGHVQELRDGIVYVQGTGFLPIAWEVGFNHFAGRLGMSLPETSRTLQSNWPETAAFHWGLGSLLAADTAGMLWVPGEAAGCQAPAAS